MTAPLLTGFGLPPATYTTLAVTGSLTASILDGNGSGLTNLNGAAIAGTIPLAAVPQLDLATNAAQAVDLRIAGLTASAAKPVFSTETDTGTPAYVRSTACWAHDLDLTCISPWNSRGGAQYGGALIAPDIVAMAWHFGGGPVGTTGFAQMAPGDVFRFIDGANNIVNLTVQAAPVRVGSTDIALVQVSPAPASIAPAQILPAAFASSLALAGLPCCATNQTEHLLVFDIVSDATGTITIAAPTETQRLAFNESWGSGDSGSPAFLILGNRLVLLGCAYTPTTLPSLADNAAAIQTAIAGLGSSSVLSLAALPPAQKIPFANLLGFPAAQLAPAGGASNQVLKKNSNADYDFSWGSATVSVAWTDLTGKPFTLASAGGNNTADSGKAVLFGSNGGLTLQAVSGSSALNATFNGASAGVACYGALYESTGGSAFYAYCNYDVTSGYALYANSSSTTSPAVAGFGAAIAALFGTGGGNHLSIDQNGALSWNNSGAKTTTQTNLGLGSMATQAAGAAAITGGTINGTTIGATTPSTIAFTTGTGTGALTLNVGAVQTGLNVFGSGTPIVTVGSDSTHNAQFYYTGGDAYFGTYSNAGALRFAGNQVSLQPNGTVTVTVTANAVAITGTLAVSSSLSATTLKSASYTVSGLPSASTAGAGTRAFVTDATATTFLSVVAGSGSNAVPVVSNGTNWLIG